MAHTFHTKPINKTHVNHIDENKLNNYYKNLEWPTNRDNVIHSVGKKVDQIDIVTNKIIRTLKSCTDAGNYLNMKNGSQGIIKVCKGKRVAHHGYKWRYSQTPLIQKTHDLYI